MIAGPSPRHRPFSQEQRAELLLGRRQQLLARLTDEHPRARALAPDKQAEVIDEAIYWAHSRDKEPVHTIEQLEKRVWVACHRLIKRVRTGRMAEGMRLDAGQAEFEPDLARHNGHEDPVYNELLETYEGEVLAEFYRLLSPQERQVLAVDTQVIGGRGEKSRSGYKRISAYLQISEYQVRKAQKEINRKLHRFSAVVAHRERIREDLGVLLPLPPAAAADRRWREVLVEWATRPFAHDATASIVSTAGSSGGRIAAIAAALCAGGAGGTYCVVNGVPGLRDEKPAHAAKPRAQRPARAAPTPAAAALPDPAQAAQPGPTEAELAAARRRRQAAAARRRERARAQTAASGPTAHEQAAAVSPAAPNAAADGSSEFDPTFVPSAPPQPAPPANSGLPEFP